MELRAPSTIRGGASAASAVPMKRNSNLAGINERKGHASAISENRSQRRQGHDNGVAAQQAFMCSWDAVKSLQYIYYVVKDTAHRHGWQ